jgi:hypothetical protein
MLNFAVELEKADCYFHPDSLTKKPGFNPGSFKNYEKI